MILKEFSKSLIVGLIQWICLISLSIERLGLCFENTLGLLFTDLMAINLHQIGHIEKPDEY